MDKRKKIMKRPFHIIFHYFCTKFMIMRKLSILIVLVSLFGILGCSQKESNKNILQRTFYQTVWERFDYVKNTINIEKETTFDLSMDISFTDDYPYDDFSMVFSVFDSYGNPYRSKAYKFNLKDENGQWKSQKKEGCYTFNLPINKALQITDPGTYCFQVEYRMPITPIVGVKQLSLVNNN